MEFNLGISKLGKTGDITGLFSYLISEMDSKNHCLLESAAGSNHEMLFSFIAIEPDIVIRGFRDNLEIYGITTERGERMKEYLSNEIQRKNSSDRKGISSSAESPPFNEFAEKRFEDDIEISYTLLDKLSTMFPTSYTAMPELFPRKVFSGGLLGYIGYDIVADYAGYDPDGKGERIFPDILMGFFSEVLAYSHTTRNVYVIRNNIETNETNNVYEWLFRKFKRNYEGKNAAMIHGHSSKGGKIPQRIMKELRKDPGNFKNLLGKEKWNDMIAQTKEYISAGDIIQAVISRRMAAESSLSPLSVYEALKILNPSPYMYYINFGDAFGGDIRLIGSSPEALIRKEHIRLETHPIAGTRRRGRDPGDEKRMEMELLNSEKELAEHIMLVDLARNDLAKISVPGSIDTYEFLSLKKFPNVMHLVSKVKSISYRDPFTVLKSVFPAGTVSGAPKLRAMEIINELEPISRGPYAGTVGYISFTGDMDMAIAIRTLFNKNSMYYAQAGAGIVADSKPEEEYLETANKMGGILSTISLAEYLSKR